MPFNLSQLNIVLDGTGTEIPSLLVTDNYNSYNISGTATAIGNYGIVPTGTPVRGTCFNFIYKGVLDITTNGVSFSIFGTSITQQQLFKEWQATCTYNGASWDVIMFMDDSQTGIISTANLADNSVTTVKIADLNVTTVKIANSAVTNSKLATDSVSTVKIIDGAVLTAKIADDAVTNVKIVNDAVSTSKLQDLSVSTAKINDLAVTEAKINSLAVTNTKIAANAVQTSNILDASVTNVKLSLGTPASVKIANNAGVISDLVLGLDEVAVGNGTTVVATNTSTICSNCFVNHIWAYHFNLSFETDEVNVLNSVWIPYYYHLESILVSVTKTIEATDNAYLDVFTSVGGYNASLGYYPMMVAGTPAGTIFSFPTPASNILDPLTGGRLIIKPFKGTPGGKILVTLYVKQMT